MIIDCISDLHGHYPKLEGGDLLIVAGDLTTNCALEFQMHFNSWLYSQSQKYKKIIVIAGNHDNHLIHIEPSSLYFSGYNTRSGKQESYAEYLCDSGTEFEGLRIWGSPWTKTFPDMNPHCKAFTCETEEELAEKWALIPDVIDILITHSPPYGILDLIDSDTSCSNYHVGSKSLAEKVQNMKNPPVLWIWGHIHESYGSQTGLRTEFVNASHVNEHYEPVNMPIRIEL